MGQGRAPFLPMPFLGVAATMRVRGGGIVDSVILFFLFGLFGLFVGLMGWLDESYACRNA